MIPLEVPSSGNGLEAGLVLPEGETRLAVVLCHGLPSGSPRDPEDPGYPGLARDLAALGLAAATFSFRGCYGSPGDFSLSGWVEDLARVVDAVAARVSCPLAVAGSSLGGAVALLHSASDQRVKAVATLAAPAGFEDLAASVDAFLVRVRQVGLIRTPGFPHDVGAWGEDFSRLAPERAAAELGLRPLLIVHGSSDDVVPPDHARRLARHASGPVTTVVLPGAGHQIRRVPVAIRVLSSWLLAQA